MQIKLGTDRTKQRDRREAGLTKLRRKDKRMKRMFGKEKSIRVKDCREKEKRKSKIKKGEENEEDTQKRLGN